MVNSGGGMQEHNKGSESRQEKNSVDRRDFLKAAATGAALVASAQGLAAQQVERAAAEPPAAAADVEVSAEKPGSDFMMDVLQPLGFEYMTINPHSDSRGLQESVINYTGNKNPEL